MTEFNKSIVGSLRVPEEEQSRKLKKENSFYEHKKEIMADIQRFIVGDRKETVYSEEYIEVNGFGLAEIKEECQHQKGGINHYYIEGKEETTFEALKAFWADYKNQGPYLGKSIIWRLTPAHQETAEFHPDKTYHSFVARFSIW